MGSARFGVVGAAADAGDTTYFAHLLQVDTDFLLDYANEEFAASVVQADAKIPLTNDTRADRDNYYRTPTITFLPSGTYWVELTMHRADTGLIVAGPTRYYIRDGSIAAPPASIDGTVLWAALEAIALEETAAVPSDLGNALMLLCRKFLFKSDVNKTSGLLKLYNNAGNSVLLQQTVADDGTTQTVGKVATP